MNENDWLDALPQVLSWEAEPDIVVGDVFVFDWTIVTITEDEIKWAQEHEHDEKDPTTVPENTVGKVPAVYLTITAIRRSIRRGAKPKWIAEYVASGIEDPEFMDQISGSVTSWARSIDKEAERMDANTDGAGNEVLRDAKRRTQRVVETKRQMKGAGPGTRARLRNDLSRLDDVA